MNTRSLSILRACWEALRDGRTLPKRMQIDPRGIGIALQDSFIAERIAPGQARLRIAGTALDDLMGTELRGLPLSALLDPDSRAAFATALEQVFDRPALAEARLIAAPGLVRRGIEARLLLLPLRDDAGAVTRLLGGLCHSGGTLPQARRLALQEMQLTPVDSLETAPPTTIPAVKPVPGLAEAPAPFAPAPSAAPAAPTRLSGTPHLRLVVNRD